MIRSCAFLTAALLTFGLGDGARAADEVPDLFAPEITTTATAAGWYLRGDVGYTGWTGDEGADYTVYDAGGAATGRGGFDDGRFSHPVSYGLGVGYQFNDMFRADVTAETFRDRFNSNTDFGGPCVAGAAAAACGSRSSAIYRGVGILANGYVDLGTVVGLTPYIGAGVGATQLRWGGVSTTAYCADGEVNCVGGGSGRYDGRNSWRFTYALMAGVSYDVSERVKLDVGYRYSDIAGGDMFGAALDGGGRIRGDDDGFSRHEIRAGLRISLW